VSNKVHFILQAKGGVGKSFVAALLAQQYLSRDGEAAVCIDTDPANRTLSGYKSLGARQVNILEPGSTSRINPRAFDALLNAIAVDSSDFIVDSGASSFLALTDYLLETRAIAALLDVGKEVHLHTVITGGQALRDTLVGFDSLVSEAPPEAKLVVWLNEYFGPIEVEGKGFRELTVYERNRSRVTALVTIPKLNPYTSGKDLELMISKKLTFAEALTGGGFGLMEKQRLRDIQKKIFAQLALVV
jgi:CobQ/CobB/MinD/ParA nucleotide binding domain